MALEQPPLQQRVLEESGRMTRQWWLWLSDLQKAVNINSFIDVTSDTTLPVSSGTVICDPTSAAITVTLPTAASAEGITYRIKKAASVANTVTVDADGSETIDGATTQILTGTNRPSLTIYSDGTEWHIL